MCLWQREKMLQCIGGASISKDWWPLMHQKDPVQDTFFPQEYFVFHICWLKASGVLPQEITYDLSGVFLLTIKSIFLFQKTWCFLDIFFSLSLKERSLKIRVAEILGEKKLCSHNFWLTFFLSEDVWCVLWVFYLSIKLFSAAWIHKKWQQKFFFFVWYLNFWILLVDRIIHEGPWKLFWGCLLVGFAIFSRVN